MSYRTVRSGFYLASTMFCSLALSSGGANAETTKAPVCTVVADAKDGAILYSEGTCDERFSPASTFKVPLALMGYDSGILLDAHTPSWSYQEDYAADEREHKTTDPTLWEKESIVWFSQKLTQILGLEKFEKYVTSFEYGNQDISGDPGKNNGLTRGWLSSSLKISPNEQVRFLWKLLTQTLPVSEKSQVMTESIIPQFDAEGGWTVKGKTGSGWFNDAEGKRDENRPFGWFVGWAVNGERRVVFARFLSKTEKSEAFLGGEARDLMLKELPDLVKKL